MPSFSREMGDLDNNENTVVVSDSKDKQCENEAITDIQRIKSNKLTEEEMTAIDMRDFLSTAPGILVKVEDNSTPSPESSPSPTKKGPEALTSEDYPLQYIDDEEEERVSVREVDETLNNAACRLRRWRAASRKLRRPRIIDNLCEGRGAAASRTDLADRLRSLAAAGGLSASAGELLSLAPPPPAATAPPSPGCLLTPTLADQSANDYFGSSPECCADIIGGSTVGAPVPAPGPRYKLVSECATRVCFFQHTRTVMDKILAAKFLRRWETHVLYLLDDHVVAKTPCGLLDKPLPYSSMLEVYCITRWDPARKYCLRIVTPLGSLLLQANEVYTRDQWFHSIIWRRHIVRYKRILTKSNRKEVVLKELKNMVDYVMTTPLQDEVVTRTPMDILTTLLSENKESPDWEDWAESLVSCAAPMLAERCANGELCAMLARLCRQRPRSAPLPALGPPVRRVLTRNVDFARAPNARRFVRDYISALSAHNSGPSLVRRFVEVTHGNGAKCPHPRAAPNLAAVALAALDEHYRDKGAPHLCEDTEDEVLCFAYILEHMCEYEDWRVVVSGVLQPVPLCAGVMRCPRVAKSLGAVLGCMARDPRCAVHACLAPARTARPHPPTWLKVAAPSEGLLALSHTQLCQLWGDMLGGLINCCCKRKSFLQSLSKQLPDFVIVALTEHPAVLESICCMLEWELTTGEQTQLEMIAALQATDLGKKYYTDLCTRQINLQILQSEGGPRKLALPVRATDQDVAALLETGSLGNLECLSLAFTSVTSECAQHLIKLPSLRYLNLWATQFGDSGVQLIAEHLPRLQVLNLCETPVSDKGIEALSALSNLRRLNLNSTRLSSEAFDTLRQRLPHLQEYDVRYTEAW